MRLPITIILAIALLGGEAFASTRPIDTTAELKALSSLAGGDVGGAILAAEAQRVSARVFTTPPEPLASVMGSVCGATHAEIEQGYGRYVSRHVREPAHGAKRAIDRMSRDLRRHVRTVSRTLPDGKPTFLMFGETLAQAPTSWDQAARQRAEWASVLGVLRDRLIVEADRHRKYELYVAAGFWSRLDCLSARADRGFLDAYREQAGEAPDDRTSAALALLTARAQVAR